MRVNVYAEEMTDRIEIISKEIEGQKFTGLRFYLELPVTKGQVQVSGPFIHGPGDDDSSAVTFWGKRDLRDVLRKAQALLDEHYDGVESKIVLTPVDSSQIEAVGYDDATKTLALKFKHGGSVYHYDNVPPELYADFSAAESKGSFFGKRIKNGSFNYRKIVDTKTTE